MYGNWKNQIEGRTATALSKAWGGRQWGILTGCGKMKTFWRWMVVMVAQVCVLIATELNT